MRVKLQTSDSLDVPTRKKVVITQRFKTPPDWPIVGHLAEFTKRAELMQAVFIVLIGLIKNSDNPNLLGNIDLLVFALRIYCPMWDHKDGNNLGDMLTYYKQTREINKDLDADKIWKSSQNISFETICRQPKMKDKGLVLKCTLKILYC